MFGNHEHVTLLYDVHVYLVPDGTPLLLSRGTEVVITMARGLTFTLYVSGNMVMLSGKDAAAIGKERPQLPLPQEGDQLTEEHVRAVLGFIYDPEIPVDIVNLGLIYDVTLKPALSGHEVHVVMTLTAPGCGMGPVLAYLVEDVVGHLPGVHDVHVEVVFDPPWGQEMISEEGKMELGML